MFRDVAGLLGLADVTIANLECSLSDRGAPWPGKEEHFAAPAAAADALLAGGIDVVNMANNHVLDFGQEGLTDSLARPRRAGHPARRRRVECRAGPPAADHRGQRPARGAPRLRAALSRARPASTPVPGRPATNRRASPSVASADLQTDVAAARQAADVVVVIVHSGGEFRRTPKHNQVAICNGGRRGRRGTRDRPWSAQPAGLRA